MRPDDLWLCYAQLCEMGAFYTSWAWSANIPGLLCSAEAAADAAAKTCCICSTFNPATII